MQRARLEYLCRRGMRELDLLLRRYLDHCYDRAGPEERSAFLRLLESSDDSLWRYLYGMADPEEATLAELVRKIRSTAAPSP